ncbi:hypothetical protein Tco_0348817 [Tanacetum coccineum]
MQVAQMKELVLYQRFLMSKKTRQLVQMKELVLNQGFPMYPNIHLRVKIKSWGDSGDDENNDNSNEVTKEDDDDDDDDDVDSDADGDNEHEEEGKRDEEMIDAGRDESTQQTTYEQVKDDEHVTFTTVHNTQKTEVPFQSLSVSSNFANQFLNLDNALPTDNEVVSIMNFQVRHKEPST